MSDEDLSGASSSKTFGDDRVITLEERRKLFGAQLKATRQSRDQSDRDVIHLTRISPPFIVALESGNFDALPGRVFGRGFIKNICKALEVDAAALLAEYDACWDDKPSKAKSYRVGKRLRFGKSGAGSFKWGDYIPFASVFSLKPTLVWVGLPVVVVLLLLGISRMLPRSHEVRQFPGSAVGQKRDKGPARSESLKAETPKPSSVPSAEAVVPASPVVSQPAVVQGAVVPASPVVSQPAVVQAPQPVSAPEGGSQIVVKVLSEVEIKHKVDSENYQQQSYVPGQYQFAFKDRAELQVADIAKVEVEFNSRKLEWYGPQNGEKRLSFVHTAPKGTL